MKFNVHSDLRDQHAFLSGSKYHWTNYDDEKLLVAYSKYLAVERGVELHELASRAIRLGIKLAKSNKSLNAYVNDAIGYRMTPEQVLYYSPNAFGTADAISFRESERKLRIHDLKTGITPVSVRQLEVYAALFCLEYRYDPSDIEIELRVYQSDEILIVIADAETIRMIMEKIVSFDKAIAKLRMEE